ncbi:hypothetical protein JQ554_33350 [Bradyrhizobium diazoefficiens]|nr:hypothetical protein [Bradyrhizobium diazoefficiens]MBR0967873.1 hypothetical protein [Bradyrhizobium diazoefficiens]MBR0981267.1 hypothetical protein [Bradyrhizobium diazoefficiens]MBR1010724.1 hypothetical protein [Bradyrhizobium diazoefficiens]MBR1018236.1 hypothetical protein [Bradyrhizobium diazoefficiens]MBR1055564.1 hypothetical protein [Bradyrhizobium diazoefficiens]
MTERNVPGVVPRDQLLEVARKELVEFERRELEFCKKDREERAAELRLPLQDAKIH